MKFRCEREVLVDALGTASRAVSSRSGALPVLSGIRAQLQGDQLRLTGSDLDLTIHVDVTVAGESDGVAVLPAKLISDIVRALEPGAVTLTVGEDEAQISAGRSQFSLRVIPADEFPQLEEPTSEPVKLDARTFSESLKQVVRAASTDDSRPILTGVLLSAEEGGMRLVATDSYRLALRDLRGQSILEDGKKVLVPSRALSELSRILGSGDELILRLGERDAAFEVEGIRLVTRLIEGDFPNYRGLIPSGQPNRMNVDREAFVDAVRRVRLLAREATPVRLVMKSDSLELLAVTQDVGEAHEELDASYSGEELTIAFNPEYLMDGLEVTAGEQVSLETIDAAKPAVLRSGEDGEDFLYLLMPVRVS